MAYCTFYDIFPCKFSDPMAYCTSYDIFPCKFSDPMAIVHAMIFSFVYFQIPWLISSPGPKVHVNYCHHLASVVCRLSSVVCRL
jgi:hypothetical protein